MKKLLCIIAACTTGLVAGCAAMGVVTPQTTDQKIAAAYTTVTTIRRTTLKILQAKKISPADAKNVQAQADVARDGLDLAAELLLTDIVGAASKLEVQLKILNALDLYLASKEGGSK